MNEARKGMADPAVVEVNLELPGQE